MRFDLDAIAPDIVYKLLVATVVPRPIAWVTTQSAAGVLNAAPYSFFNVMGPSPPTLVLGLMAHAQGGFKDTARNIVETGQFVVNLVPEALAPAMNVTAVDAPGGVNELDLAGLAPAPSTHVRPPRIAASPVSFECVNHVHDSRDRPLPARRHRPGADGPYRRRLRARPRPRPYRHAETRPRRPLLRQRLCAEPGHVQSGSAEVAEVRVGDLLLDATPKVRTLLNGREPKGLENEHRVFLRSRCSSIKF
jgi:flavin reductase (DIM6/NTAB) family NADH-FMN oxidoreductase RutF